MMCNSFPTKIEGLSFIAAESTSDRQLIFQSSLRTDCTTENHFTHNNILLQEHSFQLLDIMEVPLHNEEYMWIYMLASAFILGVT